MNSDHQTPLDDQTAGRRPFDGKVTEVRNGLYIGGAGAVTIAKDLADAGITRILKLYWDDPQWPEPFIVADMAMDDGVFLERARIDEGVTFIREAISGNGSALVVCGLGISRSATFVLAYLIDQGMDLKSAFLLLRSARPAAWPMRNLWRSLIAAYDLPVTLEEIETWRIMS